MNTGILNNDKFRRVLLVLLCALVFLFVFRAKTGIYNGAAPVKITPSTASKLWLSGQKLEVPPVDTGHTALLWIAALFLFCLYLQREPRPASASVIPPLRIRALQQLRRYLRPPPSV